MTDFKPWIKRAAVLNRGDTDTYVALSKDLVSELGWIAATDIATALRGHVYGTPGHSDLHTAVRPIYDALGWEQAALLAAWFRDARNRPGRRPGGWPVTASTESTAT